MTFPFVSGRLLLGSAALLASVLTACNSGGDKNATASDDDPPHIAGSELSAGSWGGVLKAQGQDIPFHFDVAEEGGKPIVTLRNGDERLKLDEITTAGDSTTIRMGVFDAALVVYAHGPNLEGAWVKYDGKEPYRLRFNARPRGEGRRLFGQVGEGGTEPQSFDGTWNVTFKGDDGETYPAVGVFHQDDADVTGTFLTTTGDYRYLAGNVGGHAMKLSTFDGSHAFLFTAEKQPDGTLKGDFFSGKSGHETWTAKLDPNAKLPDANALTGMKPRQKRLDFKFPSIMEGGSISPTDPKYKGKVVVVQILGSWCPNCMDETNFLAPWYEQNKQRGVEIIGLGFERTPDQKVAAQKLLKMKQRMNIGYDIAVAGQASAAEASKALPQLAKVLAFPTTIFLDKKGEVRKVHTGFSGPGTGKYYEQEKAEFEKTVAQLLAE